MEKKVSDKAIKSYTEFYPFYLSQHANITCRTLHYIGTTLVLSVLIYALATQSYLLLLALPVCGYFFAWVGHFAFEKNKPATFTYPVWSLMGDFQMYFEFLTGRLGSRLKALEERTQSESRA